ncbi:MAG: hypothetical protein JST00_44660 [Deltaproteobacteria bacterium]|nr:hypothetical protein [Deltaproteobacteria bacterium]
MRPLLVLTFGLLAAACNARVLVSAGGEAPPEPKPAAEDEGAGRGCGQASASPRLVAEGDLRPSSLVPDGDTLWFVNDETPPASDRDPYPAPAFRVWSVAASGGVASPTAIRPFGGALALFGAELAYVRGDLGDGARGIYARDPSSVRERMIHPLANETVGSFVGRPSDLYWTGHQRTGQYRSALFRFSDGRAGELVSGEPPSIVSFAVFDATVYYLRWSTAEERTELRLEALSQQGGEPRVVARFGEDARYAWSLVGATSSEIFVALTARPPERSSIRAIPVDGSRQRVVVEVASFGSTPILEGDDLMWVDGDSGRSILQAKTAGGPITRMATTSTDERRIQGLTLDRCNAYWTVRDEARSGPVAIYARSRFPERAR